MCWDLMTMAAARATGMKVRPEVEGAGLGVGGRVSNPWWPLHRYCLQSIANSSQALAAPEGLRDG